MTAFCSLTAPGVWFGSSVKGSTLPVWPAAIFGAVAVAGMVGWVLAAFRLGPFRPEHRRRGRRTDE